MRPGFEERLGQYNELAKSELATERAADAEAQDTSALSNIEAAVNWTINNIAEQRQSTPEAQRDIYELQARKQMIMQELRENLAQLDSEVVEDEPSKLSVVTEEGGQLTVRNRLGEIAHITTGQLLTDIEWGNVYHLDPESVSRKTQKQYLVEKAKNELRQLLDEQIFADEVNNPNVHYKKKWAYEALMEGRESEPKMGHIIEKMIRSFWKKLEFDADIEFEIQDTDIYQDVEQKIDMIIRRKKHYRGVEIVQDKDEGSLGIQVTANTRKEVLMRKEQQIDNARKSLTEDAEIQDIALVSLSTEMSGYLLKTYDYWKDEAGQPPGGPDQFLDLRFKQVLFTQLLSGMFSQEEIDAEWHHIVDSELHSS